MKNFFIILLTFVSTHALICASGESIILTQETISPKQLESPVHQGLKDAFGSIHYLTLVSMKNLPQEDKIKFTIKRPIFEGTKLPTVRTYDLSMEDFLKSLQVSKNGLPFHVVQGLGYIPGEEVEFYIEVGQSKSNVLSIAPYPIKSSSKVDRASVTAKLKSIGIGLYELLFDNFNPNEEIEFVSESFDELIKTKTVVTPNLCVNTMPGVIGKTGGNNKLSIKRANGETITLEIPWGDVALKLAARKA